MPIGTQLWSVHAFSLHTMLRLNKNVSHWKIRTLKSIVVVVVVAVAQKIFYS